MTTSFLGVTADFFPDHQRHNIRMGVKHMPSPYTAENIHSIVLADWNVPLGKVGNTIITDNGSSIVKALKNTTEFADENNTDGNGPQNIDPVNKVV